MIKGRRRHQLMRHMKSSRRTLSLLTLKALSGRCWTNTSTTHETQLRQMCPRGAAMTGRHGGCV
eukprot:14695765-Ditylum_brightwellii.AAC.1